MTSPDPRRPPAAARAFFALTALSLAAAMLASTLHLALLWREPGTVYLHVTRSPGAARSVRLATWDDGIVILRHTPPAAPVRSFHPMPPRGYFLGAFALPLAWLLAHRQDRQPRRRDRWLTAACAVSPMIVAIVLRNPNPPSDAEYVLATILAAGLMLYLAPPSIAALVRLVRPLTRAARRRARGLCPSCGYDLRATPDRCPECGAAAATLPPA